MKIFQQKKRRKLQKKGVEKRKSGQKGLKRSRNKIKGWKKGKAPTNKDSEEVEKGGQRRGSDAKGVSIVKITNSM